MPFTMKVKVIKDEVGRTLSDLFNRMGDLSPAMKNSGEILLTSIRKNFETGGRPQKWPPLKPSTIKQRILQGHWPGSVLVRHGISGGLLGSLSYRTSSDKVVVSANKVYAAIHHFGGQAGRGRKVSIPARPFMMVQDEDWDEIKAMLAQHIFER